MHSYCGHCCAFAPALTPGYQQLIEDARKGAFDIVVAEALDRISRDQEHIAAFYKHLRFSQVRIVTVAEGEVSELHVGLKGTMNALFLKDLALKIRRGQQGVVAQGRSAGGIAYGYRVAREVDTKGEPVRGGRTIDRNEAEVVVRIFEEYASGLSSRAIGFVLMGIESLVPAESLGAPRQFREIGVEAWASSTMNRTLGAWSGIGRDSSKTRERDGA